MSLKEKILEAFRKYDTNGNGTIDKDEFERVLQGISKQSFSKSDIEQIFKESDANKDGAIDYTEFYTWVTKDMQQYDPKQLKAFKPLDKRGKYKMDYRKLIPERYDVDVESRFDLNQKTIGEGGYGKVYIARDKEQQNRKVAIKSVEKQGAETGEDETSTYKEIQLMQEMDHPNIAKLLGTFEKENSIYFIMELLEGGEVFDRIVAQGYIAEALSANIVKQVMGALAYAHKRQVAHRDIKPENVVFCSADPADQQVKLIDWGLAHGFGSVKMHQAVGSMTYAAPEVMQASKSREYNQQCDLWSVGVFTYVMLCGKPPFWGSWESHLRNAKAEKFPMQGAPWNKMNPKATRFIKSLLKAKPSDRPPAAEAAKDPWLIDVGTQNSDASKAHAGDVVANIASFVKQSTFSKICITAVARQLDHSNLKEVHKVFSSMDKDNNGVLSRKEIMDGLEQLLGKENADQKMLADMFESLDLDGGGSIDYTEFCAAGLCHKTKQQDEFLWAAFKTFDTDNSGFVTKDNLKELLDDVDIRDEFSPEVCSEVAKEILEKFDFNKDVAICFDDFKKMMNECWDKKSGNPNRSDQARQNLLSAMGVEQAAV